MSSNNFLCRVLFFWFVDLLGFFVCILCVLALLRFFFFSFEGRSFLEGENVYFKNSFTLLKILLFAI